MASSSPPIETASKKADAGFATVTALGVSLALSMTVSLILIHAEVELGQARRAMARTQAEYALDSAAIMAARAARTRLKGEDEAAQVMERTPSGQPQVTTQLEAPKFSIAAAKDLPDGWLTALGITDPDGLRAKLLALAKATHAPTTTTIAALADAPLWRRCAEDGLSPYGAAASASAITEGQDNVTAAGLPRVVRIIATQGGWRDDRLVRLSSDPANPVILLDRRFTLTRSGEPACPAPPHANASLDIG